MLTMELHKCVCINLLIVKLAMFEWIQVVNQQQSRHAWERNWTAKSVVAKPLPDKNEVCVPISNVGALKQQYI